MTRDEIAAEEAAIRALADELERRSDALIRSKIEVGNAEFAARGISVGSMVLVINRGLNLGKVQTNDVQTPAIFLGYEACGPMAVPGLYAITRSGKPASRRLRLQYASQVDPAEQNKNGR